jgi:ABC-2 type transport system permease protein
MDEAAEEACGPASLPIAKKHGPATAQDHGTRSIGAQAASGTHQQLGQEHGCTRRSHGTRDESGTSSRAFVPPAAKRWAGAWWKAYAFLVRDARIETTYKFQFLWSFATVVFTIATLHFVARLVPPGGRALGPYKGDYFSFALIGVVMGRYLETALTGITTAVRQAMTQGTIEIMFVSPTRAMTILSLSAIWHFLFETIRVVFCLAVAAGCFGLRLEHANWVGAAVTLLLTIPAFLSLGVMSAGLLILLKRGDPVNWFAVGMASLLGGVMFPVDLLPVWLRAAAYAVPLTHSLNGFRGALLLGKPIGELWGSLGPLLLFSALMLPTAWLVSSQALHYAKRRGSLGTY